VIAQRAAEFREHEDALHGVLAEFFAALDGVDAVRADAEAAVARVHRNADARIAQATERAGREAAGFEERAQAAVRRMLELGEDARAVAAATGLTVTQVRAARRAADPAGDDAVSNANDGASR
jgi:hypothetical protein